MVGCQSYLLLIPPTTSMPRSCQLLFPLLLYLNCSLDVDQALLRTQQVVLGHEDSACATKQPQQRGKAERQCHHQLAQVLKASLFFVIHHQTACHHPNPHQK